jgi:hypothetical protein
VFNIGLVLGLVNLLATVASLFLPETAGGLTVSML